MKHDLVYIGLPLMMALCTLIGAMIGTLATQIQYEDKYICTLNNK